MEITETATEEFIKAALPSESEDAATKEARRKRPFTHFLSIQISNPEIKKRFNEFKTKILEGFEDVGEKHFQSENKLHLTLGILSLTDKTEIDKAMQVLKECKEQIIDPIIRKSGPLSIHMAGLQYMNRNPSAVHILYGKVHEGQKEDHEGLLQTLADNIVNFFTEKGFMKKERENVTLHVTLLNTVFIKRNIKGKKRPKLKAFDAREILKTFENFEFGVQELDTLQLSEKSNKGPDGYYKATSFVACIIES